METETNPKLRETHRKGIMFIFSVLYKQICLQLWCVNIGSTDERSSGLKKRRKVPNGFQASKQTTLYENCNQNETK